MDPQNTSAWSFGMVTQKRLEVIRPLATRSEVLLLDEMMNGLNPKVTRMKTIALHPLLCNGYRECETACSVRRSGRSNPEWSCIRVISHAHREGFFLPVLCFQCSDPPCLKVCPEEALFRDEDERVMIRYERCIGCRMCQSACPFGAMGFDEILGRSFKCDLCDGDPSCVRVCEPQALRYVEREEIGLPYAVNAASRFVAVC